MVDVTIMIHTSPSNDATCFLFLYLFTRQCHFNSLLST